MNRNHVAQEELVGVIQEKLGAVRAAVDKIPADADYHYRCRLEYDIHDGSTLARKWIEAFDLLDEVVVMQCEQTI